jgi:hypothetical protein
VTGTFLLERVEDHGNGATASKDNHVFFVPGNNSHPEDESYGVYTTVSCDPDQVSQGANTTCRVSFTAPAAEMPNFYWLMDGQVTAAWPGQVAND